MPAMNELADYLLEKETITGDEFMTILEKYLSHRVSNHPVYD